MAAVNINRNDSSIVAVLEKEYQIFYTTDICGEYYFFLWFTSFEF